VFSLSVHFFPYYNQKNMPRPEGQFGSRSKSLEKKESTLERGKNYPKTFENAFNCDLEKTPDTL